MSAAAEYYGYLLSQGYGESQIKQFAEFARSADRGEISHNQAYRKALNAGWHGVDGEEGTEGIGKSDKKGFGGWMQSAQEAGWIDSGLGIIGGLVGKGRKGKAEYTPPPKQKKKTGLYVLGAIALVGIGVAIYFGTRKK